jgi:hypothetical protein
MMKFFLEKGDKRNWAGSGFRLQNSGFRLQNSGFRLQNSGKFTIIHVPRNGILSIFLFRGMGSERNSESFVSILFHGTEFRAFFSSAEWVRNGIPRFLHFAEQAEFRGNKPIFPPFRLPRNNFFVRNCQP